MECQCYNFRYQFEEILAELGGATTLDAYYESAGKLQNYYAEHLPFLALYWDNMMFAYAAKLNNLTVDAVFGLNNVNNWFTITEK